MCRPEGCITEDFACTQLTAEREDRENRENIRSGADLQESFVSKTEWPQTSLLLGFAIFFKSW